MLRPALIILALIGTLLAERGARAETVTGWNADTRVVVSLQVKPEAAQQWLTGAWQVNPAPSGPAQGANAVLVFVDQHLTVDADGKPAGSGINRILALVIPGKHSGTGETASVVARLYSADPGYVPSPYKNAVAGQIRRERIVRESSTEPASGREMWTVRDSAGGVVELAFEYTGGLPARSKSESKVYSAVEPTFFRIYRVEQGADVVKSVPANIDRVQNFKLTIGIQELRKLFDGSEKVVAVTMIPWYVRQVSLP
jgi:hypothetical protein